MKTKLYILYLFTCLLFVSCGEQEARRPVTQSKTYTLAETSEEMKKINQLEEAKIKLYMKSDSTRFYISSPNGYWFTYLKKIKENAQTPETGDLVQLEYEIRDLSNQILYNKEDLGVKSYKVDKEDFIPALQFGVKEMKVGETIKFVIPSYNAFGVVGDDYKIGINQSIISIVTLKNIYKENEDN